MAAPKKPHRRSFFMPPAETPKPETKPRDDVYELLRNHIAYAAATRAEVRALRNELHKFSEDIMKISELFSSVDRLISVAKSIKDRADNPTTPPEQPDDPAVQELADKIERAIAVLEGREESPRTTPENSRGLPGAADPPSAEALATDINSRDPNAPV